MTRIEPHALACPSCASTNAVPLSDGTRLCLDCRTEWNPETVRPPLVVVNNPAPDDDTPPAVPDTVLLTEEPPAAPSALDAVLGPPTSVVNAEAAQAALDAMVGTSVVLEGGQRATVVGFPDDDHVEVDIEYADGDVAREVVSFDDVVRSVDAPPPAVDVPDETATALARVNFTVAGLVLRAGLASIAGEYPSAELLTPPSGWLPLDAEGLPALEQGTAYAIAFLVHAYSIDRDQVAAIADTLLAAGRDDDEETETDN